MAHVVHTVRVGGVEVVDPLHRRGLLDLVTGSVPVVDDDGFSIRVLPTPGDTSGHQSVVVTSGGQTVLLAGDAFVHAVQVVDPSVTYTFEDDPERAVVTRTELLEQLRSF
jgi:glyoxylase-like metal-dependent hydrolase (beta-lactamase superfamily II)